MAGVDWIHLDFMGDRGSMYLVRCVECDRLVDAWDESRLCPDCAPSRTPTPTVKQTEKGTRKRAKKGAP